MIRWTLLIVLLVMYCAMWRFACRKCNEVKKLNTEIKNLLEQIECLDEQIETLQEEM